MTAAVVEIKREAIEVVSDLPELIRSGEVTHSFIVYRTKNGDVNYKCTGLRDATYLVGMAMKGIWAFDREHGWEIDE